MAHRGRKKKRLSVRAEVLLYSGVKWPPFIGNISLHPRGFQYPRQARSTTKVSLRNACEEFSVEWECAGLTHMKLLFYGPKMVQCRQFHLASPNRKPSMRTFSFTPSLRHDLLHQKILKPQHTASGSFTAQHEHVIDKTPLPVDR